MALELASLVAKRWPTVVSCAAYEVFSADELASLLLSRVLACISQAFSIPESLGRSEP